MFYIHHSINARSCQTSGLNYREYKSFHKSAKAKAFRADLLQLHREMVRKGFYAVASALLSKLVRKQTEISIGDGYDEAYESGLAYFLLDNAVCTHKNSFFRATIN